MDTRWQRIKQLFQAAYEKAPEQRSAYLKQAADDTAMRLEVETLLHSYDRADSLLGDDGTGWHPERATLLMADEESAGAAEVPDPGDASASEMGADPVARRQRIGRYRVQRELGQGGMGTIYLATRDDDEFKQKVAIKMALQYRAARGEPGSPAWGGRLLPRRTRRRGAR